MECGTPVRFQLSTSTRGNKMRLSDEYFSLDMAQAKPERERVTLLSNQIIVFVSAWWHPPPSRSLSGEGKDKIPPTPTPTLVAMT